MTNTLSLARHDSRRRSRTTTIARTQKQQICSLGLPRLARSTPTPHVRNERPTARGNSLLTRSQWLILFVQAQMPQSGNSRKSFRLSTRSRTHNIMDPAALGGATWHKLCRYGVAYGASLHPPMRLLHLRRQTFASVETVGWYGRNALETADCASFIGL